MYDRVSVLAEGQQVRARDEDGHNDAERRAKRNEEAMLLRKTAAEIPLPFEMRFTKHFSALGISQVLTGCLTLLIFVVYIATVRGRLLDLELNMYLIIGGAVSFVITGWISLSISKRPTGAKVIIGFLFGMVNTFYDIILAIVTTSFIPGYDENHSNDNVKVLPHKFAIVVLMLICEILKAIQSLIFLYYISKQ